MYHYVRKIQESRYPGIKGLELDLFKKQLSFLKQNGFSFATVEDIKNGKVSDKSVLLTFDDGYIDHYSNVFPILLENNIQGVFSMPAKIIREKKVLDVNKIHYTLAVADKNLLLSRLCQRMDHYRGSEHDYPSNRELYDKWAKANRFDDQDTIFIKRMLQVVLPEKIRNIITDELFREFVTDCEEKFVDELYMNMEQIDVMKNNGMFFAYHGYDHDWMTSLNEKDLREDVTNALEVFDGVLNPKNWCCCYPYGRYNDAVINVIKDMGATMGIAINGKPYRPARDSIFEVSRLDTNDFPPKSENYKNYTVV